MLKHIVFVLGSYYPNYSAVGICAREVAECLKNEFRITVVSIRGDINHASKDCLGLVDIVRVDTSERTRRLKLEATPGRRYRALLKLHRASAAFKKLRSGATVDQDLVQAYLQALESLEKPADIVLPLVFPFESVLAALKYKKLMPDVLVFPYLFDNFVESSSLHLHPLNRMLKERRHLSLEQAMLEGSDAVLAMHPLHAHFVQHFSPALLQKIHFLEHPLLSHPEETAPASLQSIVTLSYTGSLIDKVRQPDYLLVLLKVIRVSTPVQVDFYVMGNKAHKVKNVKHEGGICIVNHGHVSKARCAAAIMQSNILLNLGEVRGKQLSSKVFEYMAAGKPIIHLAYVQNDSVTAVLAKYPLALCLVQEPARLQENARRCAEFIDRHKQSHLSFTEVASLYPEALPSATADLLRKLCAKSDR